MYEPYGERKRFSIDINKIKDRIKNIKLTRHTATLIAIVLVIFVGGFTGYFTYTSKVAEVNSRVLIAERQLQACQDNITVCLTDLGTRNNELVSCQDEIKVCEDSLKETNSNFETCAAEKIDLENKLFDSEEMFNTCKQELESAQTDIKDIEENLSRLECNYAKEVCGARGFQYYFVKDKKTIICCLKADSSLCAQTPGSGEDIKEITC